MHHAAMRHAAKAGLHVLTALCLRLVLPLACPILTQLDA